MQQTFNTTSEMYEYNRIIGQISKNSKIEVLDKCRAIHEILRINHKAKIITETDSIQPYELLPCIKYGYIGHYAKLINTDTIYVLILGNLDY